MNDYVQMFGELALLDVESKIMNLHPATLGLLPSVKI